jgi:general secretion pathway protein D
MRTQEASDRLSLDRYDLMRTQQQATQPEQRKVMPINDAPVMPPQQAARPGEPLAVPGPLGIERPRRPGEPPPAPAPAPAPVPPAPVPPATNP